MNRDLLHRFFEGKTTVKEEKQIREWLEISDENLTVFNDERLLYDTLLFSSKEIPKEKKRFFAFSRRMVSVAAVVLLILVSSLYLLSTKNDNDTEQYNTLLVPAGQRINLLLSDGTNVWLNANTSFRYPTRFLKKNRTVYLDGEAYFDVSENKKKPFIVKTGQGDIQVTGTSFNVDAYSRFNTFETSLFEGSVDIYRNEVKLASMNPNEKSKLENNQLSISKITDTDAYLWRKGFIAFNDKRLEDIVLSLEKYFDVTIQIDSEQLPQYTYTGKFRQSDGVDYALRVLQQSICFTYERNEETGIIYIKTFSRTV